jgi:hypothetical protein
MADILPFNTFYSKKRPVTPIFLFQETFSCRKMNYVNKFKKILYIRIFKKLKSVIFRDKYFLNLQNFFKLHKQHSFFYMKTFHEIKNGGNLPFFRVKFVF